MRTAWDLIAVNETSYNNPNVVEGLNGLDKLIADARMHAMTTLLAKMGVQYPKETYRFMQLVPADLLYELARELSE